MIDMRTVFAGAIASALVVGAAFAQEAETPPEVERDGQAETAPEPVRPAGPMDMAPARDPLDMPDIQEPDSTPQPEPEAGGDTDPDAAEDADLAEAEGEEELPEERWLQKQTANLRGLDKITGRKTDFVVTVGEPYVFGSLSIELQTCFQRPPEEPPESASFLRIQSLKPMSEEAGVEPTPVIFSGWMFASSPGLSALEHPVYDVWVIECETPAVSAE